jgi:hypothetical protein
LITGAVWLFKHFVVGTRFTFPTIIIVIFHFWPDSNFNPFRKQISELICLIPPNGDEDQDILLHGWLAEIIDMDKCLSSLAGDLRDEPGLLQKAISKALQHFATRVEEECMEEEHRFRA